MTVPELSLGSYGREAKLLQQQLLRLGHKVASSEVARSLFGPSTRATLMRWQQGHNLSPTGVLDERTSAALSASDSQNGGDSKSPAGTSSVTITVGHGGGPSSGVSVLEKAGSSPAAVAARFTRRSAQATSTQTEASSGSQLAPGKGTCPETPQIGQRQF